jgi:uroporphyrinogen decarboxylase
MNPEPDCRRILTAIRLQEPDRVPLAELGISRSVKAALLGRPIDCVLDELESWWRACYDYVYLRPAYEFPGAPDSAAIGTLLHSDGDFDTRTMEQVGPIRDLASFETCPWPDPETVDCSPIETAAEHLPNGMGIISGVGGIFTRSWMLLGFERFCVSLGDDPELVGKVFRRVGQIQCDVLRRIVRLPGVFAVWYGDDLAFSTSLLVSPDVYRRHLYPWMEEMVSIAHGAGMPFIFHTDGNIWRIMDDIVALGVDALHPIEPKAMDIFEVKRQYGKHLALFGNLDLGSTLVLGTPAEVRSEVRELIRRLAPGGGYAVGSSNIVTKYVPLANFNAMREAVLEYGSYPIDL